MFVVRVTTYRSNSTTLKVGVCLLAVSNQCAAPAEALKIHISLLSNFNGVHHAVILSKVKNKSQLLMDWIYS